MASFRWTGGWPTGARCPAASTRAPKTKSSIGCGARAAVLLLLAALSVIATIVSMSPAATDRVYGAAARLADAADAKAARDSTQEQG